MGSRGGDTDDVAGNADAPPSQASDDPDRALSLEEAAALFKVSKRTLLRALSFGELDAHKARGIRGQEWRVTQSALTQAGYAPREDAEDEDQVRCADCRRLREQLAVERARNADLDNRLGHALLIAGRLRGQLLEAGMEPDPRFTPPPE